MENKYYFETHITTSLPHGHLGLILSGLPELAKEMEFYWTNIIPEEQNEVIFTKQSKSYEELEESMIGLIARLKEKGYPIKRYKIESTLIDSKHDDKLGLL